MWTYDDALSMINLVGPQLQGFHLGLTGSVLFKGKSRHDLDLIIYPRNANLATVNDARDALEAAGFTQYVSVEKVHARWRRNGSTDDKHVEVFRWGDKRVDVFFLGFKGAR